jgi:predicted transcriptional regulator of viral defense system
MFKTKPSFNNSTDNNSGYKYKQHSKDVFFVIRKYGQNYMNTTNIYHNFLSSLNMPLDPFTNLWDWDASDRDVTLMLRAFPSRRQKLLNKFFIYDQAYQQRKRGKKEYSKAIIHWKNRQKSSQPKHHEPRYPECRLKRVQTTDPDRRFHNGVGLTIRGIVVHRKLGHVNLPLSLILPQNKISIHFLNIHQLYLYIIHMVIYCVIVRVVNAYLDNCLMSLKFIQELAKNGLRVFTIDKARIIASSIGLKQSYVPRLLSKLSRENVIVHLIKGTYAVSNTLLPGSPLHPYEVAMGLIQPAAICCWSAMIYHSLSDQILRKTFILTPHLEGNKNSSIYTYVVETHEYVLIRVKPENFWGIKTVYIDSTKVYITDLERTLLDGLVRSKYCGGILEVISAFERAAQEIDPIKLYNYVLKCSHTIQQRLGWILDHLKILPNLRLKLEGHVRNYKTCAKLNPEGQLRGKRNLVWKIVENI